ncbi:hypothetical protein D3C71_1373720 [compost metagenome]
MYVVFAPPGLEIRRYGFQLIHQLGNVRHPACAGEVAAEGGQHGGRLRGPVREKLPHAGLHKQHPQQVAPARRLRRKIEHPIRRGVPHHHVPTQVQDVGRPRGQVVHQAAHLRRHRAPGAAGFSGRALMRKQIKMAAFGGVQLQNARQVFQEGGRHADVAALLKPRVPGQAHAGQRGDLLAAQPRRAATAAGGQAQVRRVEACTPQAQEFSQVGARAVQAFGGGR